VIGIDFDFVRRHVPLLEFLLSLGLELRPEGDAYRCRCPLHDEQHGRSLILYADGRWFCHGKCAADWPKGGDVIDMAGALWGIADRRRVIERLVGDAPKIASGYRRQAASRLSPLPKWPARNLEQIDKIVRGGFGLYDLWESSPIRFFDGAGRAEEIIDILFPGNPLLCIGETAYRFATRRREDWDGRLSELPLIVANPMLSVTGIAQHGGESEHTLDATAARIYLPIEFDFSRTDNKGKPTVFLPLIDSWERDGISILDACAALLRYLADRLPLVVAVHSGGRSVHGWFAVFDRDEESESWPFMRRAFQLGCDPVTWRRSQFVRLADGRRQNGVRQATYYLDPGKAVKE
jgi:hypothetical protein